MSLRINTNVESLAAQRHLNVNHDAQNKSIQKLSSGSRINAAADDAAGLAISEKLRANIRSMKQATRNANDGISLIQVAEGGMSEISNILIRMRELSIQAASDTIGDNERSYVEKEMVHLKAEVDRISQATEFNGTKLLNGSGENLDIQIGINNDPIQDRFVFDTPTRSTTLSALGLEGVSVSQKESAQTNLSQLDAALNRVSENRASLGALQNRLNSSIANLNVYRENLEAANSRIRDTDMAEETGHLVKANILSQANTSVLGQANSNPQLALKLL